MTHVCHAAPTMLWHTRLWRGDTNGYTIPEPLSLKVVHSGEAIIGGAGDGDDLDVPLCGAIEEGVGRGCAHFSCGSSKVIGPQHSITLSLIHISEPTRRTPISYAVFCL